eukprot:1552511-Lingulodinium_polyedra.AAC.1
MTRRARSVRDSCRGATDAQVDLAARAAQACLDQKRARQPYEEEALKETQVAVGEKREALSAERRFWGGIEDVRVGRRG